MRFCIIVHSGIMVLVFRVNFVLRFSLVFCLLFNGNLCA